MYNKCNKCKNKLGCEEARKNTKNRYDDIMKTLSEWHPENENFKGMKEFVIQEIQRYYDKEC